MKRLKIGTAIITLTLLTFFSMSNAQTTTNTKALRHVVLFKFKDSSKAEDVKKVEEAFKALPGKLSIIKDFEWGTNNSPENLNQGLNHCFLASFAS